MNDEYWEKIRSGEIDDSDISVGGLYCRLGILDQVLEEKRLLEEARIARESSG